MMQCSVRTPLTGNCFPDQQFLLILLTQVYSQFTYPFTVTFVEEFCFAEAGCLYAL